MVWGITGIPHALEHMMFRGTKKYGPGELARLIKMQGGDQNASDPPLTINKPPG